MERGFGPILEVPWPSHTVGSPSSISQAGANRCAVTMDGSPWCLMARSTTTASCAGFSRIKGCSSIRRRTLRCCCGCTSATAAKRYTTSAACSPSLCGTGRATSWCSRGTLGALRDTDPRARRVSLAALDAFLTLGYIPAPQSIWDGINKLPAGTMLRVSSSGSRCLRYWALEHALKPFAGRFAEAVDRLEDLLTTSVTLRLRSDVPLGLFLSGGIDSSLVTAIAARQSGGDALTFSLGFAESAFDESGHAERIAQRLGTRHRTFTGRPDMLDVLPALVRHFGEPFADDAALAVWMLARETRKHVTVVLTGDGGDEGFGGYDSYRTALRLTRLRSVTPMMALRLGAALRGQRPWAKRIQRALRTLALDEPERFAALRTFVGADEVQTLYAGDLLRERRDSGNAVRAWLAQLYRSGNGTALRRMRLVDLSTSNADCLMPKVDVATMAHGLEARSPLLDQEVLEFALGLPDQWLVDGNGGKPLLKALLQRFVPAELFQRPKHGFSTPLRVWFGSGPISAWADQLA